MDHQVNRATVALDHIPQGMDSLYKSLPKEKEGTRTSNYHMRLFWVLERRVKKRSYVLLNALVPDGYYKLTRKS